MQLVAAILDSEDLDRRWVIESLRDFDFILYEVGSKLKLLD